jgi:hypothetical protein
VKPTSWRLLVGIAVVAAALTWAVLQVYVGGGHGGLPDVPWVSAIVLALFGGAVLVSAFALRPRLQRREGHRPLDPLVSARFAVLSQACSRVGAAFVGVYAGFVAYAATDLTVDFRKHVAFVSGVCVLAALLLLVAGLVLERACRVPPRPDDDEDDRR